MTGTAGDGEALVLKDLVGDAMDVLMGHAQAIETAVVRTRRDRVLRGFRRRMQVDDYSCGVQCAMSILEFFGHDYTEAQLKKSLRTTKRSGTSDEQIVAFMREHDLRVRRTSRIGRAWIERAIRGRCPVLVSVDGDHWAVVYGIGPENVYVSDPALTRAVRVVGTWDDFRDRLDGLGIAFGRR